MEGMALAKTVVLNQPTKPDYSAVPSAVFSHPELATVVREAQGFVGSDVHALPVLAVSSHPELAAAGSRCPGCPECCRVPSFPTANYLLTGPERGGRHQGGPR